MAYEPDIAAIAPTLELTLNYSPRPTSLRCVGTLDARTQRHMLQAVDELLAVGPSHVTVDVRDLRVADSDGANALTLVQRMVRDAGAILRWRGIDADHLRGLLAVGYRVRRPRRPSASHTDAPVTGLWTSSGSPGTPGPPAVA